MTLFYPLPDFLVTRVQCVQFAAASFVEGRYVNDVSRIRRMGWLPVKEGRDFHLLNLVHKALYRPNTTLTGQHMCNWLKYNTFKLCALVKQQD